MAGRDVLEATLVLDRPYGRSDGLVRVRREKATSPAARILVGVLGVSSFLAGCAATGASQTDTTVDERSVAATPRAVDPTLSVPSSSADHLPPEELLLEAALAPTDDQLDAWETGTTAFISRCLAEKGFTQPAPSVSASDRRRRWNAQVAQLYFDDTALVAQYGYNIAAALSDSGAPSASDSSADVDNQAGAAMDECSRPVQERYTQLASPLNDGSDLSTIGLEAQSLIMREAATAPELADVTAAWADCMRASGYVPEQAGGGSGGSVERALADLECRQSTGMGAARINWLHARVQEWIQQNPTLVAAILEFNQQLADAGVEFLESTV